MRENEMSSEQRQRSPQPDDCKAIKIDGVNHIELKIRNINGEGVLFSEDGKMIGHQIPSFGFYYYVGHGAERVKMYRATFRVDSMKSDVPNGDK
jgi:hypothetical protein